MEHSVLHALELIGQIVTFGGVLFVLWLVRPAGQRLMGTPSAAEDAAGVIDTAARWTAWGALGAALATAVNVLVEAEETQNQTVFGGVDLSLVVKFICLTKVGRLSLLRIGVLLLIAAAARLPGMAKWWLVLLGSFCGIVLTALVSHAAAQPAGRAPILVSEVTHIIAASCWVGVLVHLLVTRRAVAEKGDAAGIGLLSGIVQRFSPFALAFTTLLGASGVLMICHYIMEPSAVITSAYGLTMIVKVLLIAPAIYAGYINFRVIRPALTASAQRGANPLSNACGNEMKRGILLRFGKMLELEVTAGILVITVAGILASVSPPGQAGEYRLTDHQAHALLWPHLPFVNIVNPNTFYGAPDRTEADLRYAEFTHNWSGVIVSLLGLCWLLQNTTGPVGKVAQQFWPFLLVPFAVFIAVAADPEVWLFRLVTFGQVVRDPQLLEHQLGAAMVLVLAWIGWRNNLRTNGTRWFGFALSVILAAGGILLLGHAHSTLNSSEELTNLINVQHAIFGTFIIFAGLFQWLVLRGLFPRRAGNFIWPSLVIGLGLYMAFYYREVV